MNMIAKLSALLNRSEWVGAALVGPAFPVGIAFVLLGSIGMALAAPNLAEGSWPFILIGLGFLALNRIWWYEHRDSTSKKVARKKSSHLKIVK